MSVRRNEHVLVGHVLDGKYRILRVLGRGGSGIVFEAENISLHRPVAIKVVRDFGDAEAVARLEREAQLIAMLQHPNVCVVHDVGRLDDWGPYLVTERLFGETLAEYRTRCPKSTLVTMLEIMGQVLSALHAAHAAQIVHRDLTPRNVFLVDRLGCAPVVKLVDFGIAKDLGDRTVKITRPGQQLGTLRFMSPEQMLGEPVTSASDLFAAGILAYELLTGVHPFGAGTATQTNLRLLDGDFTPVTVRDPLLPPALDVVFARAFARDPAQRYVNAWEMQTAFARARTPSARPAF